MSNPLKRILVVAFGVPPTRGPNPPRAWHLARHLPSHGWEVILLTPKHPRRRTTVQKSREHRDHPIPLRQVVDPTGATFWLQETEYRDILLSWRKKRPRGDADQSLPGLYGREIISDEELGLELPPMPRTAWQRVVHALRCRPDARAGWIEPALQAARAVAQAMPYDTVVALSAPRSGHTVARRIARERKIPCIIDDLPPSFDEGDLQGRNEGDCEPTPANAAPLPPHHHPLVLIHAGPTAVNGRDPLIALDAARRLLDSSRVPPAGLRLRFLGAGDPRLGPAISARSLGATVTLEPEAPWLVSIETQTEASALLLCLGPGDAARLPDRAVEAHCARRPLLVTGRVDAGVREFLTRTGAGMVCEDSAQLADAIVACSEEWRGWHEEGIAPYRARNVVAELAKRLP